MSKKSKCTETGARGRRRIPAVILVLAMVATTGCGHCKGWGCGGCGRGRGNACGGPYGSSCQTCAPGRGPSQSCEPGCRPCHSWQARLSGCLCGWRHRRSNAIPEALPLGSTVGAHYQVMETNAEAADFILHRHDFVDRTVQLTPDARDKIPEIAARMCTQPFPVLIERSENNADPGLDQQRRDFVARILCDLGAPDADLRTVVSPSYGRGFNAIQAEQTYYQYQ